MAGALGVVITTDVPMSGQHAQPVYVDDTLPIVGPAQAIVVTAGEVPQMGGPPMAVRLAPSGTPAIGPALPVYVVAGSLGSAAAPASSLLTGLSVFYKLSDLTDSGPNGLTLTNNNAATFVAGKIGNAVNLVQASTQFLSRADNAVLRPHATNGFTIACWFNRTTNTATHNLFCKGGFAAANTEYMLFCSNTIDRIEAFVGNGTTFANPFTSNGSAPTGSWHLAILKSDGVTVSLRIDNGAAATAALAGVKSNGTGALNIGAAAGSGPFNGLADAAGMWQRCLSAAEETMLWNSGAGIEWPF